MELADILLQLQIKKDCRNIRNLNIVSHEKMAKKASLGELINYHVIPPVFLVFFTAAAQYLAHVGNPDKPFQLEYLLGNGFAWKCIGILFAWAIVWLRVPSKKFYGPVTSFGLRPEYQVRRVPK